MSTEKIDYRSFMNGYRDPLTREAELEEMREVSRRTGFAMPAASSGSGERECGYREEGGTYAEVPSSPNGKPLEHFITCVPVPIDRDEYRLHPKGMGVTLVDLPETCLTCGGGGQTVLTDQETRETSPTSLTSCSVCGGIGVVPVTHIFDVVGTDNYPNVADFIEEARRRGVSRRLELEAKQYARLTPRSRLIMLHKRAVIFNPESYYLEMPALELDRMRRAGCPKNHPQHKIEKLSDLDYILPSSIDREGTLGAEPTALPGCAALWWNDIEKGESIPERVPAFEDCERCDGSGEVDTNEGMTVLACSTCGGRGRIELDNPSGRFVERKLKSGTYRGYSRPSGVIPQYALGIFAIFPLVKITVIDPEGKYEDRVAAARNAKVDVDVEEY